MKRQTAYMIILSICLSVGIILGIRFEIISVALLTGKCYRDSDCAWVITNCCSETAGAKWECVNTKTYEPVECPQSVLCPQVISPKPEKGCVCVDGECVEGEG